MKGCIVQRSKGSWRLLFDAGRDPETGKRRQKSITVRGTKNDAERKLREMLHSLETGGYVNPTRLTVGEWLDQWCKGYVAMHTTPRTAESYQVIVKRHLVPALGALLLTQLQPHHLHEYYVRALSQGRADGKGGLSPRSVLYHHRMLAEALGHAVKMGLVARNVADAVDPPRPSRPAMTTLAPKDIPRLLSTAEEMPYHDLFYTALYTGLRLGELLALRWCDVDLDLSFLSVVQTLYRRGDYVIKEPKSRYSRRTVALPPSLALLLRRRRAEQEALGGLLGKPITYGDFVFAYADGSPLDPSTVSHAFARTVRKAGLPHIRFHDLRHSHATLMLSAGVHPKVVSERLGHSSVAFTLDTYSHVLPGLQERAAQRFDEHLVQISDVAKMLPSRAELDSDPQRTRTSNLLIKSQLLYQLS